MILSNLPPGYEEAMNWGMISYQVPLERYPKTYNGEPLLYTALAAQKNNYSLYLMGIYQDEKLEKNLRSAYEKIGKELDMGKSCIRFKKPEDLPLKVIGEVIASVSIEKFIETYEKSRGKARNLDIKPRLE